VTRENLDKQKPALVFSQNRSGKKTTVTIGHPLFASTYIVEHFDIENGVLSFETDDGRLICTNRPFFLKEEIVGKKI
jgi:hypothetical protein